MRAGARTSLVSETHLEWAANGLEKKRYAAGYIGLIRLGPDQLLRLARASSRIL